MVGDFATFLVQNDLLVRSAPPPRRAPRARRVLAQGARLDFPQSVVTRTSRATSATRPAASPRTCARPCCAACPVVDGRPARACRRSISTSCSATCDQVGPQALPPRRRSVRRALPAGDERLLRFFHRHADVSILDTPHYFYGHGAEGEIWVELEPGKTLVIRFDRGERPAGGRHPHRLLRTQRPGPARERRRPLARQGGSTSTRARPIRRPGIRSAHSMPGKVIACARLAAVRA
jgi:pyruvate carboxylase